MASSDPNFFPTLDAVGSGSRQRVAADLSETGGSYIKERYSVDLGALSWEIDLFGRIRASKTRPLKSTFG